MWISKQQELELKIFNEELINAIYSGKLPKSNLCNISLYTFEEIAKFKKLNETELINIITELHPASHVYTGYSYYIGGMKDTGGWYIDKLKQLNKNELIELMVKLNK
jgi:exonuclease III